MNSIFKIIETLSEKGFEFHAMEHDFCMSKSVFHFSDCEYKNEIYSVLIRFIYIEDNKGVGLCVCYSDKKQNDGKMILKQFLSIGNDADAFIQSDEFAKEFNEEQIDRIRKAFEEKDERKSYLYQSYFFTDVA